MGDSLFLRLWSIKIVPLWLTWLLSHVRYGLILTDPRCCLLVKRKSDGTRQV